MPRDGRAAARARRVAGMVAARRITWPAAAWGAVSGGYIADAAVQFAITYPTAGSREQVALTFGANAGLTALLGEIIPTRSHGEFDRTRGWSMLIMTRSWWCMTRPGSNRTRTLPYLMRICGGQV
jgi:hypothetical protein